ncbi:class III signal peptide-containing protein [Thermococcus sp. M36]|uniref:class III signal peptide-containing protein n=1 Tax=Thermococcus sp. M36 TaxID=1638261 RepID=UPI00143ABD5D|nr:class III signal peptide-containing protein [Thermococcus sp. M36]NJE05780.1 class III signal peptide-containing protein [Thermococcus sp. M36]
MRRGQISLEFMLVFGILLILMVYSVNNITFQSGSPSTENLRIQVSLEEKALANAISGTVSQVYAQGAGAKATSYVKLTFLRNPQYLSSGLGITGPQIFISYANGTYVTVTGNGYVPIMKGGNKTVFWSRALYSKTLYNDSQVWSPSGSITVNTTTMYGIVIDPTTIPAVLKVVVMWDPASTDSWVYDPNLGELKITINPGG